MKTKELASVESCWLDDRLFPVSTRIYTHPCVCVCVCLSVCLCSSSPSESMSDPVTVKMRVCSVTVHATPVPVPWQPLNVLLLRFNFNRPVWPTALAWILLMKSFSQFSLGVQTNQPLREYQSGTRWPSSKLSKVIHLLYCSFLSPNRINVGCSFLLSSEDRSSLKDNIKGKGLLFAYYRYTHTHRHTHTHTHTHIYIYTKNITSFKLKTNLLPQQFSKTFILQMIKTKICFSNLTTIS